MSATIAGRVSIYENMRNWCWRDWRPARGELADAGEDVSVIARGPHLAAINANGLKLIEGDKETVAKVKASDRIADVGAQDLVILGMKAHQVAAVVRDLPALYGPRPPCSRRRTASRGGISSNTAAHMKARGSKASIRAVSSPTICRSSACSPASSIRGRDRAPRRHQAHRRLSFFPRRTRWQADGKAGDHRRGLHQGRI